MNDSRPRGGRPGDRPRRSSAFARPERLACLLIVVFLRSTGHAPGESPPSSPPTVFATLEIDRAKVYQHEPFSLSLLVHYTGEDLESELAISSLPDPSILQIGGFQELSLTREMIAGRLYTIRRFQAGAVCPAPGTWTVSPKLMGRRVSFVSHSFFFFSRQESQEIDIPVRPLTLTAHALPEAGRPADFAGAAGQFALATIVEPVTVTTGDLVSVTMIVSGTGSLNRVTAPKLVADPDFKVYDPRPMGEAGRFERKFRQVLIPLNANAQCVRAVTFSYFDTRSESYRTLTNGPIPIAVQAEALAPSNPAAFSVSVAKVAGTTLHLAPLKRAPARWRHVTDRPWYAGRAFLVIQVTPPLLFLAALWIRLRRRADGPRRSRASAEAAAKAREGLARAEAASRTLNVRLFYDEIWQALAAYFSKRFECALGAGEILVQLRGRLPPETLDRLDAILQECERVRYCGTVPAASGSDDAESLQAALEFAREVIEKCERMRF